jgi:uncharacterized repeat protein (TIGR03803 family)
VFELTAPDHDGNREYVELYAFKGGSDGKIPIGDIVMDTSGNIYGVTQQGGVNADGIVFRLSPTTHGKWTETILHAFAPGFDGTDAASGLIIDSGGKLYGIMSAGGSHNAGTVYTLSKNARGNWNEHVLWDLGGGVANPVGELTVDGSGNIYGTGWDGGSFGWGTVFRLDPTNKQQSTLLNFPNATLGLPQSRLWQDTAGDLYGTTFGYSTNYSGAAFELSPNADGIWTLNKIHYFGVISGDGYQPMSGLTPNAGGVLYGTTSGGGSYGAGIVYELVPNANGTWDESVIHSFGASVSDGVLPVGGITVGPGNVLYGTTFGGGANLAGAVFEIRP